MIMMMIVKMVSYGVGENGVVYVVQQSNHEKMTAVIVVVWVVWVVVPVVGMGG